MNKDAHGPTKGSIHIGVLVVIVLVLLVLFSRVDIQAAINSPKFKSNVAYIEEVGKDLWQKYLSKPVIFVWNNLFSDVLTKGFTWFQNNDFKLGAPSPEIDQSTLDKTLNTQKIQKYFIRTDDADINPPQN